MADIKRIGLNTIGAPKKEKKTKSSSKTVRFTLTLAESNEKACPEFNYRELLANEEGKKHNGAIPVLEDDEDEASARALARKFEQKYGGGSGSKRKKKRSEDYVDLGAGYDDNDSFIDNTDAYDEIVPEEMTTAQGGFYINCGKLEYKQLEVPEEPEEPDHSDGEEVIRKRKNVKQAIVSSDDSSDDDDEEDEDEDSRDEDAATEPEPKVHVTPLSKLMPPSKPPEEACKLKRPSDSASSGPSKKKSATVKDLLKEKRDVVTVDRKDPLPVTPAATVTQSTRVAATSSSIADSIESVISAARNETETKAISAAPAAKQNKLPEGLPDSVKSLAESLRQTAKNNGGSYNKFFSASVDRSLIRLEQKTQKLSSNVRLQIFAYIAERVVCAPEVLLKNAQKLAALREKSRPKDPMYRLKAAINHLSPTVLKLYQDKCQEYSKTGYMDLSLPPAKIFPWNNDLRTLMGEVISREVKSGDEASLRNFLEKQICPLFPNGWMNVSILQQEAQAVFRPKDASRQSAATPPASSPPQRSTSVITLAESPRHDATNQRPSPQHSAPLSLKQRILQDAVGGAFEQEDNHRSEQPSRSLGPLSIEKLINDTKQVKTGSKDKKTNNNKPQSSKPVKPKLDTANKSKTAARKKWNVSEFTITQTHREPEPPPPLPPPVQTIQDDLEAKNMIEESAVAADFLSQIIHESLSGYPNADTHVKDEEYRPRERKHSIEVVDFHAPSDKKPSGSDVHMNLQTVEKKHLESQQHEPLDFHRKHSDGRQEAMDFHRKHSDGRQEPMDFHSLDRIPIESHKQPLDFHSPERKHLESRQDILDFHRPHNTSQQEPMDFHTVDRKHSESRQRTPEAPSLDPEVSVQLEMKRVMQELMELNGQMSAASEPPKLSPVHDRLNHSSRSVVDSPHDPYEGLGRSRVDKARSLNMLNNDLNIPPVSHSGYNITTPPDKRNSGVSVIAVNQSRNMNPIYGGFQEEFQRHLMQEPQDVLLVSSSPPSAFRPSPNRQQANPYAGYGQPLPVEDLRASYYNQVHQLNSHGRVQHYPDLQPK